MAAFCDYGCLGLTYIIYFRFQLKDGSFKVVLVWACGKVASLRATTTPQGEASALWLCTRGMNKLAKMSKLKFEKYFLFSDSETVLNMLKIPSVFLDSFYGPKIRECMECGSDNIPIYYKHVKSEYNPSDLGTKQEIVPRKHANLECSLVLTFPPEVFRPSVNDNNAVTRYYDYLYTYIHMHIHIVILSTCPQSRPPFYHLPTPSV